MKYSRLREYLQARGVKKKVKKNVSTKSRNVSVCQDGTGQTNTNRSRTLSRSFKHCPMILIDLSKSSSVITSGGAKRILRGMKSEVGPESYMLKKTYILTWVGLASTPRLLSNRQNCQAVRPRTLLLSSITTAFNNPFPLTHATSGWLKARIWDRKCSPSRVALAARCSS